VSSKIYKPDFRYLVLWVFLFGIIVIVFLQVISGYNIRRLTEGNKRLLNELQIQNNLRHLETDILTAESDVRGAVISGTDLPDLNLQQNTLATNKELTNLQKHMGTKAPMPQLNLLSTLINEKKAFNESVLSTIRQKGKQEAITMVSTNRGKEIRDSIVALITQIDNSRQEKLHDIIYSVESTGRSARLWGFFITAIALVAVILAFWYIINQGRQQQKMIQALNESEKRSKDVAYMKEQFLANMSHEIRTPMNSILGFTNLLRRTELNSTQREYIQNIHSAGENLLTLVNDILDLSKIEAGMMQIEETRFSLRSMISSVGAMFVEKVKEKQLAFHVNIHKDVPDILCGDAVRLTQILVNLISNAVKFTDKGEINLMVEPLMQTEKIVRIRMTLSDTGIGIAPEKQLSVFERFQQAEAETTRRFGGTGLGLSIVKQLVDLQRGTIELKSELGKGSEFILELEYKLPDMAQLYSEALAEQEEQVPLQKIKVLIAEDNAMNQQLVRHLMKSWSMDHTIVNNGEEAIEALKKQAYSIVLMDIQMPQMDGYTTTSIIRNEMHMDVPIIAMTAHAMVGEKEKCLQLGMNDYVSKPIKETVLYNIIARNAQHVPEHAQHLAEQGLNFHHISLNYLRQLSNNDKNFEREILMQFVEQTPGELSQLEEDIRNQHLDQVRRTAHSLKSTVGYVGLATELHPLLEHLEKDAASGNADKLFHYFEPVKQKCDLAVSEVQSLLDKGSL
jgi:signal transduction histidine kinase/CheY-like chemotaxis protein/HPt (histidine-containing phosphotransfer) domain-containing protein